MAADWHLLSVSESLAQLKSSPAGLSEEEAAARHATYGWNELVEKRKKSKLAIFMSQFKDLMILILLAAAAISVAVGDIKDAVVIFVILIINAIVGFIQEYRAEQAMEALKQMSASHAKVKRGTGTRPLAARAIVPGDIVVLEAGDIVPADLRLIESHALKLEEASLTGESLPVEKSTAPVTEEATQLGDRYNMAYKSTLVTYGRGVGLVTDTGMKTQIGLIAGMLQGAEATTPLQKRLKDFGKQLSFIVLGICVVLFITGILRGEEPVDMLLVAISLAVAAIPEALPATVTISLALSARKLVRQNALVRKLPAVETLGSVTFICTDKTGTLTQNKMTVLDTWQNTEVKDTPVGGDAFLWFCMAGNQDTNLSGEGELTGDPTEVALVQYAVAQSAYNPDWASRFERVHEVPFDSERKMMTTVHRYGDRFIVITKGAIEPILARCTGMDTEAVTAGADRLAEQGRRVIAYGYKIISDAPEEYPLEKLESGLQLAGYAGMVDPPRPEAKKAVEECVRAGIVPVMITGDHPVTASAIAREIGILHAAGDRVVTGLELADLPEAEFERQIENIKVYARVNPEQKLQIVKTLQKKKHFVSMTGDGVNDAPALKQANIGVAMGITGTDVSKQAAHMILLDDNFATIVKAVKEGRRIFDNIRKFIRYIMAGNSSEIWTILLAPVFGLPIPLLPIHILWINLVTDGLPALALANEPAEPNIMQRPPRPPGESVFAKGLGWHVLWVGILIGALCLGVQAWAIDGGNDKWQTLVFTSLCFSQMAHVLAIRSETRSIYREGLRSNLYLAGAVLLTFLLQMALLYIPVFNGVFSTHPLSVQELLVCIGVAAVVFHAVELEKFFRNRRGR